MSKVYKKIEAFLNKKFGEGESANGIFLTEDEADTIEAKFTELEAAVQTEKDRATGIEDAAKAANAGFDLLVNEANEILGLEGEEALTDMVGVAAAYKAKIEALGEQPGATHTKGAQNEEDEKPYAFIDFSSSIYNN